jgi:hypothetical protein
MKNIVDQNTNEQNKNILNQIIMNQSRTMGSFTFTLPKTKY